MIKLNSTHDKTLSKICIEENFLNEVSTTSMSTVKIWKNIRIPTIAVLFNNVIEVLHSKERLEKKKKKAKYRGLEGETTESPLFTYDMTTYSENSKHKDNFIINESLATWLNIKINKQKSVVFIYTSNNL